MNKKNCDKYISPFRFQLLQSFPYIAEDFDKLTEYQLFCKLVEKINEVIGNENAITKEVNEIKDYLDTLDLQDEVNNKLDEMAESGELQEIVATYLNANALWCFDNVQSMKNATNLIDGSYAKTLGFYSKNDGGSSLYKIRTITNDDVVNEMNIIELNDESNQLIAELISNNANIKQLGAKGDGTTDNTTIIQFALTNYENVYVPNGEYIISNTLHMNNCKRLKGENPIDCVLISNNSNIDILKMKNGPSYSIEISNLTFKHETIGDGNGIVFGDNGVWQLNNINNCRFTNNNIAIYVVRNTGSLYSSRLNDIEIFNYNEAGIELCNVGSSGNIYSNIYMHNNDRTSRFGFFDEVEDNLTIENLNVEWGTYSNAFVHFAQVKGHISNIHFEGATSNGSIIYLYKSQIILEVVDLITTQSITNIFDITGGNNYIDINTIRLHNTSQSNITCNLIRYQNNVVNSDRIKIKFLNKDSNVTFDRKDVLIGCHLIPEICEGIFSEKIINNWKLYRNGDATIKDATYRDMVEFLTPVTKNGNQITKGLCVASGVKNDVSFTTGTITQFQNYLQYPKTSGTLNANTSLKINDELYYTTGSSYSYDTNNYRVILNRAFGSNTPSGSYEVFLSEAIFSWF